MMRPRTVVVVLAVLAIALPATASAPTLQYEQFDSDAVEIRDRQTSLVAIGRGPDQRVQCRRPNRLGQRWRRIG